MNFTEEDTARILAFIMPPSDGPAAGWRGYALRVTVLTVGLGIYVLLFRKKAQSDGGWSLSGSQQTRTESDHELSIEVKEISDDRSAVTYNGEVCPICLGEPSIGVKAPCGHMLCADCLASYCDVRITPAPPPCPLCRAPLNPVALACDFAILGPKMLDPTTIMVQDWIREYNNHGGLRTPGRAILARMILLFNILILFLIVGLIAARLQVLSQK